MAAHASENKFSISWHDSAWIPILNSENVLEYFCQRSNTFYDKTCNNEHVKMQRLDPAQLQYMTGIEYAHIHAQEPILYVIRKQMRHSPTQVTSLATYYILGGVVYQAPDIGSLINSRLLSTVHKLQSAFAEAQSYSKYNPSKGYWWQFKDTPEEAKQKEQKKKKNKAHEPSSIFQRQRVNLLLNVFAQKFPPKAVQEKTKVEGNESAKAAGDVKVEIKQEPSSQEFIPANIKSEPNVTSLSSPHTAIAPIVAATTEPSNKPLMPPAKKRKKE